jgi:hypothetical protein
MTGKRLNSFKPARENSLIVRAARLVFAGIKRLVFCWRRALRRSVAQRRVRAGLYVLPACSSCARPE